ncbi:MAG: hypothetical protein GY927_25780 [bacterium]|nr:hypothetical protein [bacterium]
MSETKTQEKVASSSKKPQADKPDAGKSKSDGTVKTSDANSSGNANSAPKSASESSISHFSSVSTPAYKAGWESIFGGSKAHQKRKSNSANDDHFPDHLTIDDEDIDEELRSVLFKVFQKQARKQGISLAKIKKRVEFSYTLNCGIEEK